MIGQNNEPPEQLVLHAVSIQGGVLFNWKEQLSPIVSGHVGPTFQRLTKDGVFSYPQETVEWIPDGQVLVYKLDGVVRCPDIARFAPVKLRGGGKEVGMVTILFRRIL
jgi:hypothetical protein